MIDILKITLADNVKARELLPDGTYRRVKPEPGVPALRSQVRFLELAAEGARLPVVPEPEPAPAPKPRVARRSKREQQRRSAG